MKFRHACLLCLALMPWVRPLGAQEVSVEETVAAARRGGAGVAQTLRQAAEECGQDPAGWQRQVILGVIAIPVDSFNLGGLMTTASAIGSLGRGCRDLPVEDWVRSALDSDLDEFAYRMVLGPFASGGLAGYRAMDDFLNDRSADPAHRLWVSEALIASSRTFRDQSFVLLPGRVAGHYQSYGLTAEYVAAWLPMLLAAVETREATARDLLAEVARNPDQEGAADVVRVIGTDVGAYAYRFSPETLLSVGQALEDLAGRSDVPTSVSQAAREAQDAARTGRNHAGARVVWRPLRLSFEPEGAQCIPDWPAGLGPVVEAVAPGFRARARRQACDKAAQYGDFDGDGAQDVLLHGTSQGSGVLLAVIAGERPSAHVVSPLGSNDSGGVFGPAVFHPACDGIIPEIYVNDWISVGYDEKYSANFRFDGSEFERLLGDEC